jgi:hypothetical protein
MKSTAHGKSISGIEVTHISIHGFWIYIEGREYFLAFDDNPWFRTATIDAIHDVMLLHKSHLHWPKLDIDLELDAIVHPERYPLKYHLTD